MFGRKNVDNLEFNRRHMVAVRLVDAINFTAAKAIPGYKPILVGFRLKINWGKVSMWDPHESPILYIRPAGWPKDSGISCFLLQRDGYLTITEGKMVSPYGNFVIYGDDRGTEVDYQPRESQLSVYIFPK